VVGVDRSAYFGVKATVDRGVVSAGSAAGIKATPEGELDPVEQPAAETSIRVLRLIASAVHVVCIHIPIQELINAGLSNANQYRPIAERSGGTGRSDGERSDLEIRRFVRTRRRRC
jgi:hypothetical protein